MKFNLILVLALCLSAAYPASPISRWFLSSYHDLRFTLLRYARCVSDLAPLKDHNSTEVEYLIKQIRVFLDQANYVDEQLDNVTALMNRICIPGPPEPVYPIPQNLDVPKFSSREARCRAIEDTMDVMYPVFRRAALNKSELLDFSRIRFIDRTIAENGTTRLYTIYNVTDLINTSWILINGAYENVCDVAKSIKQYVTISKSKPQPAQDRVQKPNNVGFTYALRDFIDRFLESLLGEQRRLYWEGTNRLDMVRAWLRTWPRTNRTEVTSTSSNTTTTNNGETSVVDAGRQRA